MKIKIALCDDVEPILHLVEDHLLKLAQEHCLDIEIHKYNQSWQLLNVYQSQFENYHIIFLDINMPEVDGFTLAKAIREIDEHSLVIFLSSNEHLVFDSFQYQPFRFIRKFYLHEEVPKAFLDAVAHIHHNPDEFLYFKTTDGTIRLRCQDIIYFEACGHKSCIYTTHGEYTTTKKMKELEDTLKNLGFIRIHNGHIINTQHVKKLSKLDIELSNDTTLSISRYRLQEVKKQLLS